MPLRPRRTAPLFAAAALAVTAAVAPISAPASADPTDTGDVLVANHSFESGLDGWTFGQAGRDVPAPDPSCRAEAATDRHADGSASLKLTPTPDCPRPAALGSAVDVRAGTGYHAYLQVAGPGATVRLRLVFRAANGSVLDVSGGPTTTAGADFTTVSAHATAPAGTATATLRLDTADAPAYLDDALVTATDTDLGPQVSKASINATTFGVDGAGARTAYTVVTGASNWDAHLVGITADTGAVAVDLPLTGATGAWNATTATDGSIYVGTYNFSDTSKNGRLYRYVPGADSVQDLGNPIPGDTFVWDVTAGPDGSVFGGGYPSGGAFRYSPAGGFTTVGARPMIAPEQYVRSVAYDASTDVAYAGIGSHAHLMACPGAGTDCTDILPTEYAGEEFTYSLEAGGGYVFANLSNTGDGHLLVMKVTTSGKTVTATKVTDIPSVRYPGASPVVDGGVYYLTGGRLMRYDLAAGTSAQVATGMPASARSWSVDTAGPAPVLESAGNTAAGPVVMRYDTGTRTLTSVTATHVPAAPTNLQSPLLGPDGKIYTSGFLSGGTGVHTPMRSDADVQYAGVPQVEGATVIGDTMYFGGYPGAKVYAYRPAQPWTFGTNPKLVCSLTDQDQDRPYGMVNAGGKLVIGTEAGYGKLAGALAVYDPATGDCTTKKNIADNRTVASLAYLDGLVYGGTSVWGGLGVEPSQQEAVLLTYDPETGASQRIPLPSRGLRTVLGLTVGPDGNLWMLAEDHLLVYDPATRTFVADRRIFPELDLPGADLIDAHDAFLLTGKDGNVYGTLHGRYVFRLDPRTLQPTLLRQGTVEGLTADRYGNLYYVQDGCHLHRLVP